MSKILDKDNKYYVFGGENEWGSVDAVDDHVCKCSGRYTLLNTQVDVGLCISLYCRAERDACVKMVTKVLY